MHLSSGGRILREREATKRLGFGTEMYCLLVEEFCLQVLASEELNLIAGDVSQSSLCHHRYSFICSMGPYGALHAPKTYLVLSHVVYLAKDPISGDCKFSI
eukprot:GFUD01075199.1.p1 GENE.GFUD01075199.1~~GFUD01075199.1.p1  ORF type:complete len:101 (-),score=6.53 GFUD01075199.1:1134-1436(-)